MCEAKSAKVLVTGWEAIQGCRACNIYLQRPSSYVFGTCGDGGAWERASDICCRFVETSEWPPPVRNWKGDSCIVML